MDSRFLIDALTVTSKIHSPENLIELFGLEKLTFENRVGRHGYSEGLYFENAIAIYYEGRDENMGVCIELSGQGCRAFETYGNGDYDRVFQEYFLNIQSMKITRLDVAFDDQEGLLDIQQLSDDTRLCEFVSKFKSALVEYGVPTTERGNTIYLGSKHSDFFIRIYDKAKERGFTDGRHWIRIELQMRQKYAMSFIKDGYSPEFLKAGFMGVLKTYIRYVDDPGTDSNRWRWPLKEYWSRFLGAAEKVQLFDKPGTEYNLLNLEEFVYKQAGNAITALLKIHGDEIFKERLRERGTIMNPKYTALIKEYCNSK